MSRDNHPLRVWLLDSGYGDKSTGVIGQDDFARFADDYAHLCYHLPAPTGESWRLIVNGHRKPSWDLAFDVEMVTLGAVCAFDLRDDRFYGQEAA
jgi:hypothetical protein